MAVAGHLEDIRTLITSASDSGFTPGNIKASADLVANYRVYNEKAESEDYKVISDYLEKRCDGIEFPDSRGANEMINYFLCTVDPAWKSITLTPREEMIWHESFPLTILEMKGVIDGTKKVMIEKGVDDNRDEFVGMQINKIIDKAPAFVYTYGSKKCKGNDSERVKIACFPQDYKYGDRSYVQVLTEFVDDSVSLHTWLEAKRSKLDIMSVILQIVANLLEANRRIAFVHSDLHTNNILIEKASVVSIPINGKLYDIDSNFRARIIDYGYSTVSVGGVKYAKNTTIASNFDDPWTDVIRMLFSAYTYNEVAQNKDFLRAIIRDYFGIIESNRIESYTEPIKPYMIVPPNSKIYDGLPDLGDVVRRLSRPFSPVRHITGDNKRYSFSHLAEVALGNEDDKELIQKLLDKYLGGAELYLKSANSGTTLSSKGLHTLFKLVEYLGYKRGTNLQLSRDRALNIRSMYEEIIRKMPDAINWES